jgi:hypothetical protein
MTKPVKISDRNKPWCQKKLKKKDQDSTNTFAHTYCM